MADNLNNKRSWMTWLYNWVKLDRWRLSAESRLPWGLTDFALHKSTQNDTTLHHSIQFSLLFPKESNNYKIQDSLKLVYISFYFSIMGPVCLQPTSTLSAGNLISISYWAFYSASVNLKWDGYCREWIVQRQKWETRMITHIRPSVLFCCVTQNHKCKQESVQNENLLNRYLEFDITSIGSLLIHIHFLIFLGGVLLYLQLYR